MDYHRPLQHIIVNDMKGEYGERQDSKADLSLQAKPQINVT